MAKIFDVKYRLGQIVERVSNTLLTIRGTMALQKQKRGLAAYTNNAANSHTFTKSLNGTYSIVMWVNAVVTASNQYLVSFLGDGEIYLQANTGNVIAATGTIYVDGIATNVRNGSKMQCIVISGVTITNATAIYLFTNLLQTLSLNGYCANIEIHTETFTAQEVTNFQKEFTSASTLSNSKLFLKTQQKNVIDFDKNITGNNYVSVPDNDSLDFGTGSFSIEWEDTYPQRQSSSSSRIIMKETGSAGTGFMFYNNATNSNSIYYLERGGATAQIAPNIPNGEHKFLFTRNVATGYIILYIDGAIVYNNTYTAQDLNNSGLLFLKSGSSYGGKTSGYLKNLKIWKGQAITPDMVDWYKTGLVLDLPMNDGTGLTCFDKSGLGNHGTITTSYPVAQVWKKKKFLTNILLSEDWKYLACDGTSILPKNWIKGTGIFKGVALLSDLGNYVGSLKRGENYLECITAGTMYIPDNYAYGTTEFEFYKGADANVIDFFTVSDRIATYNTFLGYAIRVGADESIAVLKSNGGSGSVLLTTAASYISINTWYMAKRTRSISGVTALYIKGGALGTNYVKIGEVTDTTYTTSFYNGFSLGVGDRLGKITHYSDIR